MFHVYLKLYTVGNAFAHERYLVMFLATMGSVSDDGQIASHQFVIFSEPGLWPVELRKTNTFVHMDFSQDRGAWHASFVLSSWRFLSF